MLPLGIDILYQLFNVLTLCLSLLCHGPHISEAAALDEPVTPASVTPGDVTTGAVVTTISSVQEQEEKCARDMNCKRCVALLECKFVTFEVRILK